MTGVRENHDQSAARNSGRLKLSITADNLGADHRNSR